MTKIEMITNLNDFPIGNYPETRKELLSKAEIVAFMSKYLDEFAEIENSEEIIRNYYSNLLELGDIEKIPSIMEALNELRIHPDVVQDFSKIEYIKENSLEFSKTYETLAKELGISKGEKTRTY